MIDLEEEVVLVVVELLEEEAEEEVDKHSTKLQLSAGAAIN